MTATYTSPYAPMVTVTPLKPGRITPWGKADFVKQISDGTVTIIDVSTPGHGGYFVPKKHLGAVPAAHQQYAKAWSQSPQWYEEDIAWTCVVAAFPQLFTPAYVASAHETIAKWITHCATCGKPQIAHHDGQNLPTGCQTFTPEAA